MNYTTSIIAGCALGGFVASMINPEWWFVWIAFGAGGMLGAVMWGVIFLTNVTINKFWGDT